MFKNESIIEIIFETREDELANLNVKDRCFLEQNGRNVKRNNLEEVLDKIPHSLKWIRKNIARKLEDYVDSVDKENAYFCKKYYLSGLKDGIKLKEELEI